IAKSPDGRAPNASQLEQARQIIEERVNGLGVSEPEVVTEGGRNIVISVAGQSNDAIKSVGTPAQLRFRKVINIAQDQGVTPTPSPSDSASPGASGSPNPSASASAAAAGTPSAPASSAAAAPGDSATPAPSGSAAPDAQARLNAVIAKVGAGVYASA